MSVGKYAYICVGGPLDGQHACTDDFYSGFHSATHPEWDQEAGMYGHLSDDYFQYNSATGKGTGIIFVHKDKLKTKVTARNR